MKNRKAKKFGTSGVNQIPVSPIDALVRKLDLLSCEMESRWGMGVLHGLCTAETSAKFMRVKFKLDEAIQTGDYDLVKQHSENLAKGWLKMESEALAAGHAQHPEAWYVASPAADGVEYIICKHRADTARMVALFPAKASSIYALEDIAKIIDRESLINHLSNPVDDKFTEIMKRVTKDDGKPLNDVIPF